MAPPTTLPAGKRGLFIGINEYARNPLAGCVNDVTMMRDLLVERFGFPATNMRLVTDAAATRDGILAALAQLVKETRQDDVVVIHYAGHGSYMYLPEGIVHDKSSGTANTIVPVDTDRQTGVHTDITDDEINAVLEQLAAKTSYTHLIFDCCHSATVTRGPLQRTMPSGKFRMNDPAIASAMSPRKAPKGAKGPSGWLPLADSYVLLAGCRDTETSYETMPPNPKKPHGALSWFTTEALRDMRPGTTWRDIFERIEPSVRKLYMGEPQHPQLEGRIDREVFGVKVREPMHFVAVTERSGKHVTLAAGAAMGVVPGSRWDVYPPDTKAPTPEDRCGSVKVVDVGAVSSRAIIVDGSKALVARSRATLDDDLDTIARYRHQLAVDNPERTSLTDAISFAAKRQRADGPWELLQPDASGVVEFRENDYVGFTITNGHAQPVFVTLLDFAASASIRQLHPPRGAREMVAPNTTFEIGTDPRKRRTRLRRETHAITDIETFKLIVTQNDGDFWCVTQAGVRAATSWKPEATAAARGGEDEEPAQPTDEWLTLSIRYRVLP